MTVSDSTLSETGDFPPVPPRPAVTVRVDAAARTDVGRFRENNEDHYLVARLRRALEVEGTNLDPALLPTLREEVGHVFVIADGMGGMASGEVASRMAIVTGLELVRDASKWHLDVSDPNESADLLATLRRYFQQVNRRVYDRASTEAAMEGMGTTLTVAFSVGLRLFVVHVGDSRAYLFQGGLLQQLTNDHTVAMDLAAQGQISKAQVKSHRMRNVLTNYIGYPGDAIEAEIHRFELADGDRLLLCSDGLTDLVDDETIKAYLASQGRPRAACDALIEAALKAGGRDNVTAIVADFRVETA